jgi:hypothetical protein
MPTYTENNVNYSYTVGNSNAKVAASPSASGAVTILASFIVGSVTYNVTTIPDSYVFINCTTLTSIIVPNSVTSIGYGTFRNCIALTSITLPNSVTSIANNAFQNCSSLTRITLPNSLIIIGVQLFLGCSALISVTIPNSVTSIGNGAFFGCSSLTSINIPSSVTRIGNNAFVGCSALTTVTIPNSVTSIGETVFSGCSGLTSVTIPSSVTSIGWRAFAGCYNITTINNAAITLSWHSISISQQNNNTPFFVGTFTTFDITNTTIINAFYTLSDLTTNILAHTSDDNGADFVLNGNRLSYSGITITSIPVLDSQYGAQQWNLYFDEYDTMVDYLKYKNSANQWVDLPGRYIFTIESKQPAPVITSITATSTTASISFTQSTNPGLLAITNYAYSTDGTIYTDLSSAQTTSPLQISGLTIGQTYSFRIKAYNGLYSEASDSVSVITNPPQPAPVITNVSYSSGLTKVYFTQGTNQYSSPITSYSYSIDNGQTYSETDVTTNYLQITGLKPRVENKIIIKAYNGSYSDSSNTYNFTYYMKVGKTPQ